VIVRESAWAAGGNAASGGSRTLSTNCGSPTSAFFNYGPSTGSINQFNNTCNGGDFGDWSNAGFTQSEVGTPGTNPTLGVTEIAALTAIGYDQTSTAPPTPEPPTGSLMLIGIGLVLVAMRKRIGQSLRQAS
jgi:PEP-CTERM motif